MEEQRVWVPPEANRLYEGDALEWLARFPNGSFDHCITDPPYNLSGRRGLEWAFSSHVTVEEAWDRFTHDEYVEFCRRWLSEVVRVVRPNGNLLIFGSYHNIYLTGFLLQQLDRKLLNSIVWYKCIEGNTPVLATYQGQLTLVPFRDLAGMPGAELFSYDEDGRSCRVTVKRFERSAWTHGVRLTVKSGLNITVSPNHGVPILRAGAVSVIPASEVGVGDHLLLLRRFAVPEPAQTEIHLSDLLGPVDDVFVNDCSFASDLRGLVTVGELCERYGASRASLTRHITTQKKVPLRIALDFGLDLTGKTLSERKGRNKRIHNAIPLDYHVGYLVGAYLAEGSVSRTVVRFSCHRDEAGFREAIQTGLDRFGLVARTYLKRSEGKAATLSVSSRLLMAFLDHFVAKGPAKCQRLLDPCFSAPESFRRGVLAGYTAGEGSGPDGNRRLSCTHTRNDGPQDSLIALCRTLGVAVLSDRRGHSATRQTGVFSADTLRRRAADPDALPRLPAEQLGLHPSSVYAGDRSSTLTVRQHSASLTALQSWFVEGDLLAEPVTEITRVEGAEFYDVEVSGNSMFAVANGLVTHNSNAQPNITCRSLTESTEHIVWACNSTVKKATGWTFNYRVAKELNGGKQMRNVWQIPYTPKSEKNHGRHPTQKPEALLDRLIRIFTAEGDLVLDPFGGSGTTGVVAERLGRRWLMVERDPAYAEIIRRRVAAERERAGTA